MIINNFSWIRFAQIHKFVLTATELQKDELEKAGCEKIFEEKISCKTNERSALQNMVEVLRQGDWW